MQKAEKENTSLANGAVVSDKVSRWSLRNPIMSIGSFFRKKIVIIASAVVILVAVGLTLLFTVFLHKSEVASNCTKVTTDQALLKQAEAALDPSKVAQLGPIVAKIQKISCYEKNPNYMYVVTTYNINTGNSTNSAASLNQLKKSYNSKQDLDPSLAAHAESVETLQAQVQTVQATADSPNSINVQTSGQP